MKQSADKKPRRKAISTRRRFEIFKRDGFTCQYCGRRTPDVILHCDHIVPVHDGGTDDPINLITSCQDCNLGKSDVPLEQRPPPLKQSQESERERWKQFKAMNDYLAEKSHDIAAWAEQVSRYFVSMEGKNPNEFVLKPRLQASIRSFVQKLPLEEVMEAVDVTFSHDVREQERFRYFCGVCWNKIRRSCQGEKLCHNAS